MALSAPRRAHFFFATVFLGPALAACGPSSWEAPNTEEEHLTSAEARTLATPPDPQVGEWWTVEVHPDFLDSPIPTTLVVADRAGDWASLGIPPSDFSHDFLVLHLPPLGDLRLNTLAWRVMWDDFEALRFPLEVGRTWEADFHGNDVEAEVTRVEGDRAHVTMVGDGERIELVYDAGKGMITEFQEEALGLSFRVTDHGFGYSGPVKRLEGIELGFMEVDAVPSSESEARRVGEATASPEVNSGASHGSLSLVLWNQGHEEDPGTYRITATAPDGTVFQETFEVESETPSVVLASSGHDAVDGTWQIEFEREGPARLLVELFTYELTEVESGE